MSDKGLKYLSTRNAHKPLIIDPADYDRILAIKIGYKCSYCGTMNESGDVNCKNCGAINYVIDYNVHYRNK